MFNIDLYNIKDIVLIFLVIAVVYLLFSKFISQKPSENFETVSDIKSEVNKQYRADIDAMRNLAQISKQIMERTDTLTLPANTTTANKLRVNGDLFVSGNVYFENRIDKLLNIIPSGFIMAHYSGYDPLGWAPCDGNFYILGPDGKAKYVPEGTEGGIPTPDLRSRFIIGACTKGEKKGDNIYNKGAILKARPYGDWGGEEDVTLNGAQMPMHSHNLDDFTNRIGCTGSDCNNPYTYGWYSFGGGSGNKVNQWEHGKPGSLITNTGNAGGNSPHNNMPPYFSLKYYMKL